MAVVEGVIVDIHYLPLASVLAVVNPADNRDEGRAHDIVHKTVPAVERDGIRIMLTENIEGMHDIVIVAEKTKHTAGIIRSL